jgi:hypothetical protein
VNQFGPMTFFFLFVLLPLLLVELRESAAPRLAEKLIRVAVRRLPENERERWEEEWLGGLNDLPGRLPRLLWAFGVLRWTGRRLRRRLLHFLSSFSSLPWELVRRARYSPALAERLLRGAAIWLPKPYRDLFQAEWLGELDWLKKHKRPLLGWAIGVAGTAVFTRLELRARLASAAGRLRALPKSGPARAVRRAKPIWLGMLTAVSVFCAAAVGWSGAGQQGATGAQLLLAVSASVLAGGGVTWQTWPRGPAAEERREEEHL